ncbi:MAG: formylglycine-generating enzyme family protein [Cyanobacteria bacterium J06621_8]
MVAEKRVASPLDLDLVAISGGKFMMGSPEGEGLDWEQPQHEVMIQPFLMGKYPVTQAQWREVASLPKVARELDPNPARFKDLEDSDRRPVENVSWDDAVEFCQRLSQQTGQEYRLPSEAEWEYACRAGTTTTYYFGDRITSDQVNYEGTVGETTAVGEYPPNDFGLYDMHGNVWEWCQDDWHDDYEDAPTDGSAWVTGVDNIKVVRSGSWGYIPYYCRSEIRFDFTRDHRNNDVGFRVVCVASSTA